MVNLVRDGEPLRMSKRAGTVITLDDLIDALGVDAARYALIRYSVDTTLDLDLDLWTRQTSDNPVFYVQYAHARLASLARNAADLGSRWATSYDPALLDTARESELIALLAAYPGVLATAAELREPHRVARYLEDLASGLPQVLRLGPGAADGRRAADRRAPSPGCGCAPPPGRCWPTAWPCSASTPRSGCEGAPGRARGPASCTPTARAGRAPADLNRLDPAVWPRGAARNAAGALQPGRRRRPRPAPSPTAPR